MASSEFKTLWKRYEPLVKAVVEVFHPFVEAAVHDLETGKVEAIYHNISQRKVGEPSPIKELKVNTEDFPEYFPPYYKQNWDGRPLKCTSITMRNKQGTPIGLICLNIDVTLFQDGLQVLKAFLKVEDKAENPIEIFGSQCEEQAEAVMKQFLEEKHLSLNHLNRDQKESLSNIFTEKGFSTSKMRFPILLESSILPELVSITTSNK